MFADNFPKTKYIPILPNNWIRNAIVPTLNEITLFRSLLCDYSQFISTNNSTNTHFHFTKQTNRRNITHEKRIQLHHQQIQLLNLNPGNFANAHSGPANKWAKTTNEHKHTQQSNKSFHVNNIIIEEQFSAHTDT